MIDYTEEEQKLIVHEMESEIMTMVAVDTVTNEFEVLYADNKNRKYENRFKGPDFFESWQRIGMGQVFPDDRSRISTLCQSSPSVSKRTVPVDTLFHLYLHGHLLRSLRVF